MGLSYKNLEFLMIENTSLTKKNGTQITPEFLATHRYPEVVYSICIWYLDVSCIITED
jgi:hypothetical protein